jgi:hypothetical protein
MSEDQIEWKEDPSPLQMLKDGESAVVGGWEARIDRMKEFDGLDRVLGSLRGSMTEREREVLDMRFDLGSDEERQERERVKLRKEGQKTHPFCWSVHHIGDGSPEHFTHMGGRAATAEGAKRLAVAALEHAEKAYSSIESIDGIDWFGDE